MKIITLCGSTKFEKQYHEINKKLTLEGNLVISVGVFDFKSPDKEKVRELLQEIHRKKIDIADEIFIVNVGGYIGKHTQEEIDYAKKIGKKINYLEGHCKHCKMWVVLGEHKCKKG